MSMGGGCELWGGIASMFGGVAFIAGGNGDGQGALHVSGEGGGEVRTSWWWLWGQAPVSAGGSWHWKWTRVLEFDVGGRVVWRGAGRSGDKGGGGGGGGSGGGLMCGR